MEKEIEKLTQAIAEQATKIQDIERNIFDMRAGMPSVADDAAQLAALRDERRKTRGRALVDGTAPNTDYLDTKIKKLEQSVNAVQADADTVAAAVEILQERVTEARNERGELEQQRHRAVLSWLRERLAKSTVRYVEQVNALEESIADMVALERAMYGVGIERNSTQTWFAGQVFAGLQLKGLVVPHGFGAAVPFPHLMPDDTVQAAKWLDVDLKDFAEGRVREIQQELTDLGL